MAYAIENARYQWDEGERRLRQADPEYAADLDRVLWQIVDELRKRLGSTFTLEELAALYNEGTDWADDIAARREAGLDTSAQIRALQDKPDAKLHTETIYDFMPSAKELLDDLLPQTVKAGMFQSFLDATTSEHVSRMVAMKSATDNADKMVKSLSMQYNRARQSQITTELSEIMGGVEAMKG